MSDSNHAVLSLNVIGKLKPGDSNEMPIMLPGVDVELREVRGTGAAAGATARPITGTTDANGTASGLAVTKGRSYSLVVRLGNSARFPGIHPVVIDAAGAISQSAAVNMAPIALNWALESDPTSQPVGPGTILPHGKNVFLNLSNMPDDPERLIISSLSANGSDAQFIGPVGQDHRYYLAVSGPGMLVLRGSIGTLAPRSTSALPMAVVPIGAPEPSTIEGGITVGMRRTTSRLTEDVPLWVSIRRGTTALGFDRYFDFMNWVFCEGGISRPSDIYARQSKLLIDNNSRRFLPFTDTDAYRNIKVATESFVMANCGVFGDDFSDDDVDYVQSQIGFPERINRDTLAGEFKKYGESVSAPGVNAPVLPYLATIRRKLIDQRIKDIDISEVLKNLGSRTVDECYGIIRQRLTCPCLLELIWSYWQEEGMLVQTMNALTRRFQNIRSPLGNDPLANMEIDPLRALNNLIWGYIQDEQHRLTVVRRNYEYDHHYGLRLSGRAVRRCPYRRQPLEVPRGVPHRAQHHRGILQAR